MARNASPKRAEMRAVILWSVLFMAVGILGFVTSSLTVSDPSWKHLGESVSAAVFVLGAFSIVLEFKEFTDYTSRVLQRQLLGRDYVRTLPSEKLQELKRIVDETIIGASELTSRGGFYPFIAKYTEDALKMPYRREMDDISQFLIVPGNPDVFLKQTVTKYIFVKGFSGDIPMMVRWSGVSVDIAGVPRELDKHLQTLSLLIEDKRDKKKFSLQREGSGSDLALMLISNTGERIPVGLVKERRSGINYNLYSFEYEIPESRGLPPETEVKVEIQDSLMIPAKIDDTYYIRLSYPTRNLVVTCVFPEGVRTSVYVFSVFSPEAEPLVQGGNLATAVLDDWCLPGHGAYVAWQLPPDWDRSCEGELTETESGTNVAAKSKGVGKDA